MIDRETWRTIGLYVFHANGIVHFTPDEVAPVGKLSHGVALQAPPPAVLNNVLLLARFLEGLRQDLGCAVHVNSWYRDPEYNATVSLADHSVHPTGAAADIWTLDHSPLELAHRIDSRSDREKLGIGLYRTFTHIDVRGLIGRQAPARWAYGVEEMEWWHG